MNLDAHQHFWHYNEREYGWMGPDMDVLKKDHLPSNLVPLLQSVGFDGAVAVQARQTVEETRWLLELADQHPFIKGIVGWVDLCGMQLHDQLEQFARHSKLCGVRHVLHDEPDDRFMLRDAFVRGVAMLADLDLTYDLLIFPKHLPLACELMARFPHQRFVLDHIAKPPIKARRLEPWARDIQQLARFPNVFCKVSGMVTEADWQTWTPADLMPYLDVVFATFGVERIMIGSDWPVCTVAAPYARVMSVVMDYIQHFTPEEQKMILGDNACRFYGIQG
jgi:L-fuconolactonase